MQHARSAEAYEAEAVEYLRLADVREKGGYPNLADDYRQTAAYCEKRAIEIRNGGGR